MYYVYFENSKEYLDATASSFDATHHRYMLMKF